jgi:hypothetical protein
VSVVEPNQRLGEVFFGRPAKHDEDVLSFPSDGNGSTTINISDDDRSPRPEIGEATKLRKVCPIGCMKVYGAVCFAEDEFRSTRQGKSSSMPLMG